MVVGDVGSCIDLKIGWSQELITLSLVLTLYLSRVYSGLHIHGLVFIV